MFSDAVIRDFNPQSDFPGAYRAFYSGFHHVLWPMLDEADPKLTMDLLRLCQRLGNKSVVAEVEGDVVGILLGTAPLSLSPLLTAGPELIMFELKTLCNRYHMSRLAKKHIVQILYGYLPHVYLHPIYRLNEIFVFCAHRDFHGRGLGRGMMDAFINYAKSRGGARATVCTDTCLSWYFYPAYGFTRVREFPMYAYKYSLPGKSATGHIYSFDLNKQQIEK